MDYKMQGKTALVTGAGQGIGRSIALTLAGEGVDVAINDIAIDRASEVAKEVEALGRRSIAIKCDVSNQAEVNDMVAKVMKEWGQIDMLVNGAGVATDTLFAESDKNKDWDVAINICLYGVLNCTRAVINHMIERKTGKIVSIISDAGRVGEPRLTTYSAAKGGIIAFSKALAKEVGRYCINVNCVSPGATLTEDAIKRQEALAEKIGEEKAKEREQAIIKAYPIGRGLGRRALPEDIGAAVTFLCSEGAAFITGQTLSVSGGYSMI